MRNTFFVFFLLFSAAGFSAFEEETASLVKWLEKNQATQMDQEITIQTQLNRKVPAHRYDDLRWADRCVGGLTLWSSGSNPVPGAMCFIGSTLLTAGIWPVGCLIAAGIARGAEKCVQHFDYRGQDAEQMVFHSQTNHARYIAERLILLIAARNKHNAPMGTEDSTRIKDFFLEFSAWVGLKIADDQIPPVVDAGTLALRINQDIHLYKPVPAE